MKTARAFLPAINQAGKRESESGNAIYQARGKARNRRHVLAIRRNKIVVKIVSPFVSRRVASRPVPFHRSRWIFENRKTIVKVCHPLRSLVVVARAVRFQQIEKQRKINSHEYVVAMLSD